MIWTGENYLSTNEAMQSKYLTRNLILFVILTLFISIVCIVNNHVKAAYPDADSVTYIVDDLVHQSDNVDFQQKDTIDIGMTVHSLICFRTIIMYFLLTKLINPYLPLRMYISECIRRV